MNDACCQRKMKTYEVKTEYESVFPFVLWIFYNFLLLMYFSAANSCSNDSSFPSTLHIKNIKGNVFLIM